MVNEMKSKNSRISVMVDKEIEGKLRERQANMIKKTRKNVSFSHVVNTTLQEGLKDK